jgi:TrmH family RNA methyltransferase
MMGERSGSDISIILCRVRESGNLGSICRAMKTMGISQLRLADCPDYEEDKVRMMAVHAFDLFEKARRFSSLGEALADISLSAGFTRRVGARRKETSTRLRDFIADVRSRPRSPIALVFGNEKDGLTDMELGLCSLAVHIPSADSCPSLNVAQAVQVACYEFFVSASAEKPRRGKVAVPALRENVDSAVAMIADTLAQAGFFKMSGDIYARRFLRDLCERAGASAEEVAYLEKLFLKAFALSLKNPPNRT